jgi:hypothetical protein
MVFYGRFDPTSFVAFMCARAKRLALDLVIEAVGPRCCRVVVHGQPGLIDAFEMACSLGPLDCLVQGVERAVSDMAVV